MRYFFANVYCIIFILMYSLKNILHQCKAMIAIIFISSLTKEREKSAFSYHYICSKVIKDVVMLAICYNKSYNDDHPLNDLAMIV